MSDVDPQITFEGLSATQRLLKKVINPWMNYLLPTGVLTWFMKRSRSPLVAEMFRFPGSWRSVEISYANAPPVDWIDRLALRDNVLTIETRNRRKLIIPLLTGLMRERSGKEALNFLGVGAGPGLHMQEAIQRAGLSPGQVSLYFVDLDDSSFSHGRAAAATRGLGDRIHYQQGDARRLAELLPGRRFDVVKLVGIIEYLNDQELTTMLQSIRSVMADDGVLLTHGLLDPFHTGPFLKRTFGLKHHYRTGSDVAALLQASGFVPEPVSETPLKVFPLVLGRASDPATRGR